MKSDILNSYCLLKDNYLVRQLLVPNTTTILLSNYIAYNEWSCPYMNTSFRVNHTLNINVHTAMVILSALYMVYTQVRFRYRLTTKIKIKM